MRPLARHMQQIKQFVQVHAKGVAIGLVAASLIALLLAASIVLGWLRPGEQGGLNATPSAGLRESLAPSGSAAPSADGHPTAPSAWTGRYQLTDVESPLFNSVWARVTVDRLNVRNAAGTDARVVGVLLKGDLVLVTGDPAYLDQEWAPIVADGIAGWVATSDPSVPYLQPVATPWLFGSERVLSGVVSTNTRFLAYGWARDLVIRPYEGSGAYPLAFTSTDGRTWQELKNLPDPVAAAAAGPGGFVIVTHSSYIGPTRVLRSDDGSGWSDELIAELRAASAAWGPVGPIVVGLEENGDDTLIYRTDAPDGAEPARMRTEFSQPQVEGSDVGYVMFERYGTTQIAVSVDAESWRSMSVPGIEPGQHAIRDVELIGNRLFVVASSTDSGDAVVRAGVVAPADGSVTWADGASAEGLQGVTVDSISARDDGTLLALGWDREELVPRVWGSTDGRSWTDLRVDATAFGGGIGPEPAFAAGVWVGIGDGLYTSSDGADWSRTLATPGKQPEGPGCPPADEVTALDLMFLGRTAADCYQDTPLTMTAWAPLIDGLGGCCYPEGVPAWLNSPIPPAWVSAAPSDLAGSLGVYPSPTAQGTLATERWVRITGHFHDVTSQDCRLIPLTYVPHRLESISAAIDGCERHFVIDSIVPIDAP
jgi:hypothetical protein